MTKIPSPIVAELRQAVCPRCGEKHEVVPMRRFRIPLADSMGIPWEYWGVCPVTLEPLLSRQPPKKKAVQG